MTENSTPPIDTATVERCIELLRRTGTYGYRVEPRLSIFEEPERVEQWTFTTHPMDLLRGLIVTKTEAEKLVSEWREYRDPEDDYGLFGRDDMNTLAQFILDKQKRDTVSVLADYATPAPVVMADGYSTSEESQPRYVFGPWIEWHGGECPVPGDWMVDVRFRDLGAYSQPIPAGKLHWWHYKNDLRDITHYRVRFEVGKWYDWIGGPCPVGDDVYVSLKFRDGVTGHQYRAGAKSLHRHWSHTTCDLSENIISFKVTGAAA